VALPEGELVVNSSQGGGSKDTWVLASPRSAATGASTEASPAPAPALPLMATRPAEEAAIARQSGPDQ
jgi:hypothetical protein